MRLAGWASYQLSRAVHIYNRLQLLKILGGAAESTRGSPYLRVVHTIYDPLTLAVYD